MKIEFPRGKKCFCSWPPTWPPWRNVQTSNTGNCLWVKRLETFRSMTRTTTRVRFNLVFFWRILKNRHTGKLHCTFCTRKVSTKWNMLKKIKPSIDRKMIKPLTCNYSFRCYVIREFNIPWGRRRRKRRWKSGIRFFQPPWQTFQLAYFAKCKQTVLEWNS